MIPYSFWGDICAISVVAFSQVSCPSKRIHHLILEWRKEELERINSELDGAERKAALYMLLEQESQLIAAIGRHKLEADEENKEKRVQGFLDKVV